MRPEEEPNADGVPPDRLAAAAAWGAMAATVDLFPHKVAGAARNLIRQYPHGDWDPDNLLEHLPWLACQNAWKMARAGTPADPDEVFAATVAELLSNGPQDFAQLMDTLRPQDLEALRDGASLRAVLTHEWRRQVRELFERAWVPWRAAILRRLEHEHPLVRVALVTQHPGHLVQHRTLVGQDPIEVAGRKGEVAYSVLVHPNEAEDLLDEDYGTRAAESQVVLLPSAGVSPQRLQSAQRLRSQARGKRVDAPLRSLTAALLAAAAVHGEPAVGAPFAIAEEEVRELLTAMLPTPPPPPPRPPRPQGTGCGHDPRFMIAA